MLYAGRGASHRSSSLSNSSLGVSSLSFEVQIPAGLDARSHAAWVRRKKPFIEAISSGLMVKDALVRCKIPTTTYELWRKDLEFLAQVNLAKAIGRAGQDRGSFSGFVDFRKHYFGYDTFRHQQMIVDAIANTPPGGVTLVLVPPEFGKTSLLEDYCSWLIATNPDTRVTVVSEGQPHSRKIINRVKRRMVDPNVSPAYIKDYGPFLGDGHRKQGRPWSADFFTVAQATHDERDYTMEARGWTSMIAGTRTDLLLVDDIQSARSLNLTQKMLTVFRQDFLTRPGKEGKTIIVGTRVGVNDF